MPYIIPSFYQAFNICRKSKIISAFFELGTHLVRSAWYRKHQDPIHLISQAHDTSPAMVQNLDAWPRDQEQQASETSDRRDDPSRKTESRTPL
jgi:hypothetical protein